MIELTDIIRHKLHFVQPRTYMAKLLPVVRKHNPIQRTISSQLHTVADNLDPETGTLDIVYWEKQ